MSTGGRGLEAEGQIWGPGDEAGQPKDPKLHRCKSKTKTYLKT